MGHDALNPLHLAVGAIVMRTLCQVHHMAGLCLHHATDKWGKDYQYQQFLHPTSQLSFELAPP